MTEPAADFDRSLLIVDDDKPFCDRLARALASRGFAAAHRQQRRRGRAPLAQCAPAYAVFDLKLGDGSGLDLMRALKAQRPEARAIILTGYGAIATAVTAVKLGAFDYLAKPVNADEVAAALSSEVEAAARATRSTRCPPIGRAGSISSACSSPATATSPRPRGN